MRSCLWLQGCSHLLLGSASGAECRSGLGCSWGLLCLPGELAVPMGCWLSLGELTGPPRELATLSVVQKPVDCPWKAMRCCKWQL